MSICPMIELINAFSTFVKARVVHDVKIGSSGFRNSSLALTVQILLTCNEDLAVNTCITFCLNE